jgi:hypothetical protein
MYQTVIFQIQLPTQNFLGKITYNIINYGCVEYTFNSDNLSRKISDPFKNYIENGINSLINKDEYFLTTDYSVEKLYNTENEYYIQTKINPKIKYDIEIDEEKSFANILGKEVSQVMFSENCEFFDFKSYYQLDIDYDDDENESIFLSRCDESIYTDDFVSKKIDVTNKKIKLLTYLISKNRDANSKIYRYLRNKLLTQNCRLFKYSDKNYLKLKYNLIVEDVEIYYPDRNSYRHTIHFISQNKLITAEGEIGKIECNYDDWDEYANLNIKEINDEKICNELIKYLHQKQF